MHTTLNYFGFVQMLKSHPYAAIQSSTIETEPELRGKDVKAATPASTTCNGHSVSAPLLGCQMLRSLYSQIKATVNVVNSLKGKFTWQRTAVRACLGAATPAIWTMSYRRCRKRQLSKTLARAFSEIECACKSLIHNIHIHKTSHRLFFGWLVSLHGDEPSPPSSSRRYQGLVEHLHQAPW